MKMASPLGQCSRARARAPAVFIEGAMPEKRDLSRKGGAMSVASNFAPGRMIQCKVQEHLLSIQTSCEVQDEAKRYVVVLSVRSV